MRQVRPVRQRSAGLRRRGQLGLVAALSLALVTAGSGFAVGDVDLSAAVPAPLTELTPPVDVPESTVEPTIDPSVPAVDATAPVARPAAPAAVIPMSVPSPRSDQSVVTVKVGGIRSNATSAAPVQGVRLGLYSNLTTATVYNSTWGTCTSDAQGDCSFTIPSTNSRGTNRDRELYVKALDAPAGFRVIPQLGTGTSNYGAARHGFQVGSNGELRGGQTYRSTKEFMASSADSNTASGGWFPVARDNPSFPPQCGLDVALVLDLSGSVATYENSLAQAASALVDGLTGTPSNMSLFTFSTSSPATRWDERNNRNTNEVLVQNRPTLQQVATSQGATTVKNWYSTNSGKWANFTASGGTNWDRGIYAASQASRSYDVAVVITDGNPTFYGTGLAGNGNRTRFLELENGIFSANALKAEGTRVIAMGVGSGVSSTAAGLNLSAISGPVENSDYFRTSDYARVGQLLRDLALASCEGSVSVVKEVVPSSTTGENVIGSQPAGGWTFAAASSSSQVTVPATGTTQDSGAVSFPLKFAAAGITTDLTIAEQQQTGYTLVTRGGKNAVCRNLVSGAAVPVQNVGALGFRLSGVSANSSVSCTVYNREPSPGASVTVDKEWLIDGTAVAHGAQPDGWDAALTLTGPARAGASRQQWGAVRGGYTAGETVTIAEDVTGLPSTCSLATALTEANGTPVDNGLPHRPTLLPGANHFTVTNTVDCTQQLTLVKQLAHGSVATTAWTLSALTDDETGVEGPTGVTGQVAAETRYVLGERGGPAEYVQDGEWQCADDSGRVDVADGFVVVPRGAEVTCTVTNTTATLTLLKHVDGETDLDPAQWQLTAAPADGVPGLARTTVGGLDEVTAANTFEVRPAHEYSLTEAVVDGNPLAYRQIAVQRYVGGAPDTPDHSATADWQDVDPASVAVAGADHEIYRIVNAPVPAVQLPLTGGVGPTTYLALGGLVLALALGLGMAHQLRTRRS